MDEEEYEQCLTDCRHLKSTLAKVRAQLDAVTRERDQLASELRLDHEGLQHAYADLKRYRTALAEDQAGEIGEALFIASELLRHDHPGISLREWAHLVAKHFLADRRRAAEEG